MCINDKKRHNLESLYLKYRAGKVCLNDVLFPSVEMDSLINQFYNGKFKAKKAKLKETLRG